MAKAKDSKGKDLMAGDHFFIVKNDDPGVPYNYDPDWGGFVKKISKRGIIEASVQTRLGLKDTTLKSSSVKIGRQKTRQLINSF